MKTRYLNIKNLKINPNIEPVLTAPNTITIYENNFNNLISNNNTKPYIHITKITATYNHDELFKRVYNNNTIDILNLINDIETYANSEGNDLTDIIEYGDCQDFRINTSKSIELFADMEFEGFAD